MSEFNAPRRSPSARLMVFALSIVLALSLAACGDSEESAPESSSATGTTTTDTDVYAGVCAAAGDIPSRIDELRDYDPDAAAGAAQVPTILDEVRKTAAEIDEEIAKLDEGDRQQAQTAASEFKSTFTDAGFTLSDTMMEAAGDSDSDEQIKKAADETADELEQAYEDTFGELGCS